jgi:hypothetical protein
MVAVHDNRELLNDLSSLDQRNRRERRNGKEEMKGRAICSLLALVVTGLLPTNRASAVLATFTVPASPSDSLDGYQAKGFTFHGFWANYGNDTRNAPLMEDYTKDHSITYDAGTMTFGSMLLGGLPHDGSNDTSGDGYLTFDFRDASDALLAIRQIYLPRDNTLQFFTETIPGVHTIYFHATASYQDDGWFDGFFPRLDSIEYSPVPEPSTYLAGLGALGMLGVGLASPRIGLAVRARLRRLRVSCISGADRLR